jgi:hypothetical protein
MSLSFRRASITFALLTVMSSFTLAVAEEAPAVEIKVGGVEFETRHCSRESLANLISTLRRSPESYFITRELAEDLIGQIHAAILACEYLQDENEPLVFTRQYNGVVTRTLCGPQLPAANSPAQNLPTATWQAERELRSLISAMESLERAQLPQKAGQVREREAVDPDQTPNNFMSKRPRPDENQDESSETG